MTRFARLIRNLFERLLRRYYEGPEPPRHIGEEVRVFRMVYPYATPEQWEDFATRHAENCYRSGFTRGYEWQERDWPGPAVDPEVLAEATAHDWSLAEANPGLERMLADGMNPDDPLAGVPEDERNRFLHALGIMPNEPVIIESEDE